jgi:outer membrane protein TolC
MRKIIICLSLLSSLLIVNSANASTQSGLTIYQVMQRVLDRYPSLKISEMEVAQAAEQRQQVESSLGWILNSSAGVTHDLTGLGTPSDRLDLNAALSRQLKSGASLSLSGGYRYEDSSLVFSPSFPNPAHTTRLDLSYRMPLAQGQDNPLYAEGIISSEAGYEIARANQLLTRITLAEQVKDLFHASLVTRAQLENARQAVERTRKLSDYINKNFKLGLAEEKDQLQVKAQLHSKLADLSAIELQWKQQQTSLNRLMLEDWNKEIKPALIRTDNTAKYNIRGLIKATTQYHPVVKISQAQLQVAESQIDTARDSQQDNLDLVLSVGTRTSDGDSTTGTVSEKDWAGSVSIEYKHLFDEKGVSSKYKQALLQKNIALENIVKANDDIRYTVSGLVSEIMAAQVAVDSARQKLNSESLKLKEAEKRFRNGRADTAQLIQFQNEYSFAELSYQNQKVDLNNRIIALQIFTGKFWDEIANYHGVKK